MKDCLCIFQISKHNLKATVIADPYKGQGVSRLTKNGRIVLPRSEIGPCIHFSTRCLSGMGLQSYLKESGNITLASAKAKCSHF